MNMHANTYRLEFAVSYGLVTKACALGLQVNVHAYHGYVRTAIEGARNVGVHLHVIPTAFLNTSNYNPDKLINDWIGEYRAACYRPLGNEISRIKKRENDWPISCAALSQINLQ